MSIDPVKIFAVVSAIVTVSSLLHTLSPPWDFLDDFPTAQKYYKLYVYIVGYIAINWRSTIYPKTISMKNQLPTPVVVEAAAKTPVVVIDESGKKKE